MSREADEAVKAVEKFLAEQIVKGLTKEATHELRLAFAAMAMPSHPEPAQKGIDGLDDRSKKLIISAAAFSLSNRTGRAAIDCERSLTVAMAGKTADTAENFGLMANEEADKLAMRSWRGGGI